MKHPFAATYARRRSALVESPLAGGCLPELWRLIDFDTHIHMERLSRELRGMPDPGALDISGLARAAETVLRAAQERLGELPLASPLDYGVAYALASTQWLARRAHRKCGFAAEETKRFEAGAAGGAPLGICTGTPFELELPKWTPAPLAVPLPYGKPVVKSAQLACWQVFRDTGAEAGEAFWARWCDDCRPSADRHVEVESTETALAVATAGGRW